jgi:DNA-binding transcriptional LysR family regulator
MLHARLLTYLDVVARTGSIRQAASKLHVASSAISRQIMALEEELGTPLFQRLARKTTLTAAGEVLIRHVRETLKEHERTRKRISEIKGLVRGEITLSIMSGLAGNLVPLAADLFLERHRLVRLTVNLLGTGTAIVASVSAGEADLGLGFDFELDASVRTLAAVPGHIGAVMAPDHPLAGRSILALADCIDYPLVLADSSMVIRPYLESAFARKGLAAPPGIETNSIEVMRQAAMQRERITFLTPFDIENDRTHHRLVYVPVVEFAKHAQTLMLIGHKRGPSGIASLLAETLKDEMDRKPAARADRFA